MIITDYKNVPKYGKNAAIKFSYKQYKDSQVPPTRSLLPDMLPQAAT